MSNKIILIGLPGSGKTTIGKRLAQQLLWGFTDTDQRVINRLGASITDIFAKHGEFAFREWENEIFTETVNEPIEQVISTGGGIVVFPKNRVLLSQQPYVIYLYSRPAVLVKRTLSNDMRPLLQGSNPLEILTKLFQQRHQWYCYASNLVVDIQYQSAPKTINTIFQWLESIKAPIKTPQHKLEK